MKHTSAEQDDGEHSKDDEVIFVSSWEILGRLLSPPRLQILSAIASLEPKSIAHLSRAMKKNFKNIHEDVKFLAGLGLIELRKDGKNRLVPIAKFQELKLALEVDTIRHREM